MSERVFKIGELSLTSNNHDKSSFSTSDFLILLSILDLGLKFIPCLHLNEFNFIHYIFSIIVSESHSFNRQRFIKNYFAERNNLKLICNDLDCFFSKNKISTFGRGLKLSQDSIVFEFEIMKHINELKIKNKPNLTNLQTLVLRKFIKSRPFKIVELDKNIGVGVLNNNLYNKLCFDVLNDTNTYEIMVEDPLDESIHNIFNIIFDFRVKKKISMKLFKFLIS